MSTQFRSRSRNPSLRRLSRRARAAHNTVITLGDLVSAAYDVTGSVDATAMLLSPQSPLGRRLGKKIVLD